MGVRYEMEPLYKVAAQLKVLIAEGMATAKLRNEATMAAYTEMPAINMWCDQTMKPKTAMARLEKATNLYPKIGLREKVEISSLMIPIPGKIMM